MPLNYNEEVQQVNISGIRRSWPRARLIIIDNTYEKAAAIKYINEKLSIEPDGSVKHEGLQNFGETFQLGKEFPLIHPETGQVLGVGTHDQLQMYIYSHYIHMLSQQP